MVKTACCCHAMMNQRMFLGAGERGDDSASGNYGKSGKEVFSLTEVDSPRQRVAETLV
ncbi:hypothetical protein H6G82_02210 [Planktothricoides sp. FACHB-1261]|nr:hypothetical protein [Planktothricoides raciborskii FACHB-1261]